MLRAINNARMVTPGEVIEGGSVVLEDDLISGVSRRAERGPGTLDAGGQYLLPGIVDLHSDAIEKQLAPRPGVEFAPELAFLEMDRHFALCGITTGFHALSMMRGSGRSLDLGHGLYQAVRRFRSEALVCHELHLRCELPQEAAVEKVEQMLRDRAASIVSVMDHTPGQGQFRDLEWFRRYWKEDRGMDDAQIAAAVEEAGRNGTSLALDQVQRIARAARENGAALASHDDDTPEKVELLAREGALISEFVINAGSARRARDLGLSVCMGAPNVVRGRSSGGNLCATESVSLGLVDALCSDYHPPSMLQAAFELARKKLLDLPAAVGLVTSGPARAAGIEDRGAVREGAMADLLLVGERLGRPVVTHTVVGGEVVSSVSRAAGQRAGRGRVEDRAPTSYPTGL